MGFPGGSAGKESTCNMGDLGSIPGEGKGYPLQYSGLENSMDCIVHGVAESDTTEELSLFQSQRSLYVMRFSKDLFSLYSTKFTFFFSR